MEQIYCTKQLDDIYDNKNWEEVIDDFQTKIDYYLYKVPVHERDDLEQEIKMKIIEKLNMLLDDKNNEENLPSFWDYVNCDDEYMH